MRNKNTGFTLIELVTVIVILGTLAATAAPRFIDLTRDARIARLEAMAGAISSAVNLVHAKAIINGEMSTTEDVNIDVGGGIEISSRAGYPSAIIDGFANAVNLGDLVATNGACTGEWCAWGNRTTIPSGDVTVSGDGRIGKLYNEGFRVLDECGVYYVNNSDGSEPIIGLETDDC